MATTIEDLITLSVTDCKRLGYFIPDATHTGTIEWNRGGERVAAVGFGTDLTCIPYAVLSYSYRGTPVREKIRLLGYHSNLPDHDEIYYYFVCPVTGHKCRKLYLYDGRFVSRFALSLIYEQQTRSKKMRTGLFGFLDLTDKLAKLEDQKYRRYTYCGRLTPYGRKIEKLSMRYDSLTGSLSGMS